MLKPISVQSFLLSQGELAQFADDVPTFSEFELVLDAARFAFQQHEIEEGENQGQTLEDIARVEVVTSFNNVNFEALESEARLASNAAFDNLDTITPIRNQALADFNSNPLNNEDGVKALAEGFNADTANIVSIRESAKTTFDY